MQVLHHLGVHETQSLLLPGADEQRAVYLDAVDIDRVLVERPAADIILAAQFVRLTHAGEGDQQRLDGAARSVRHDACCGRVDMIHRALRMSDATHLYLRQHLLVGQHLYVDIDHVAHIEDTLLNRRITDHGVGEYHGVRLVEQQFVIAVFVGRSTDRPVGVQYCYVRQLDTDIVLIHHIPVYARRARVTKARNKE